MSSIHEPAARPDPAPSAAPIRRVVVGISGSIAALEVPQSLLWLRHVRGLEVRAIMTRQATTMITPRAVAVTSGQPVVLDGDGPPNDPAVPHIELTRWADLFLVVPATADILGKAANGIADDVLSTCILAASCPVVFAPSMNRQMWRKPVVQRNVALLEADGHGVVPPVEGLAVSDGGSSACMMPEIDVVFAWAEEFVHQRSRRRLPSDLTDSASCDILVEAR